MPKVLQSRSDEKPFKHLPIKSPPPEGRTVKTSPLLETFYKPTLKNTLNLYRGECMPSLARRSYIMFSQLVSSIPEPRKGFAARRAFDISTDLTHASITTVSPWQAITTGTPLEDPSSCFWWRTTGRALAGLLEKAGYSVESQYRNLLFYRYYVIPELGPGPDSQGCPSHWHSFMTDDNSPVEMSWNWGARDEPIVIRFSIEPIGPYAGTLADPLNEFAAHGLVERFQSMLPGVDLEWFYHFSDRLLTRSLPLERLSGLNQLKERSNTFVAFDLEESSLVLKAYFIPAPKAAATGQTRIDIVSKAINSLPSAQLHSVSNSLSLLFDYLKSSAEHLQSEVEILGIDCVIPAESRLKIYFRSQSTSFDSVREVMTLGRKIGGYDSNRALEELEELWRLLLWPDESYSPKKELRRNAHRTAGILYYFEIRPGHPYPTPKVYIPVRHYAHSDEDIATNLQTFMKRRRCVSEITNYTQALKTAL